MTCMSTKLEPALERPTDECNGVAQQEMQPLMINPFRFGSAVNQSSYRYSID